MANIEIKLKAFDASVLESGTKKVLEVCEAKGVKVSGPIPLPTRRERYTILRSVHVNKKSREQFEIRTHKRLVVIEKASDELMDQLKRLDLPTGVNIELKQK